jgi:hypothetical protein
MAQIHEKQNKLPSSRAVTMNVFSACMTLLSDTMSTESACSSYRAELDLDLAFLKRISLHSPLANYGVRILYELDNSQTQASSTDTS